MTDLNLDTFGQSRPLRTQAHLLARFFNRCIQCSLVEFLESCVQGINYVHHNPVAPYEYNRSREVFVRSFRLNDGDAIVRSFEESLHTIRFLECKSCTNTSRLLFVFVRGDGVVMHIVNT